MPNPRVPGDFLPRLVTEVPPGKALFFDFFAESLAANRANTCISKFSFDTARYAFQALRTNGPRSITESKKSIKCNGSSLNKCDNSFKRQGISRFCFCLFEFT